MTSWVIRTQIPGTHPQCDLLGLGWAGDCAFFTGSWVILTLLVQGPHLYTLFLGIEALLQMTHC